MTKAKQIETEETIREAGTRLGAAILFVAICVGLVLIGVKISELANAAPVKTTRATRAK